MGDTMANVLVRLKANIAKMAEKDLENYNRIAAVQDMLHRDAARLREEGDYIKLGMTNYAIAENATRLRELERSVRSVLLRREEKLREEREKSKQPARPGAGPMHRIW
ncbi:MAG: hypothetical protein ACREBH_00300 [Candidatus Micrarchaeaceae archaeon]